MRRACRERQAHTQDSSRTRKHTTRASTSRRKKGKLAARERQNGAGLGIWTSVQKPRPPGLSVCLSLRACHLELRNQNANEPRSAAGRVGSGRQTTPSTGPVQKKNTIHRTATTAGFFYCYAPLRGHVQRAVGCRRHVSKFCRNPARACHQVLVVVSLVYEQSSCSQAVATTRRPL